MCLFFSRDYYFPANKSCKTSLGSAFQLTSTFRLLLLITRDDCLCVHRTNNIVQGFFPLSLFFFSSIDQTYPTLITIGMKCCILLSSFFILFDLVLWRRKKIKKRKQFSWPLKRACVSCASFHSKYLFVVSRTLCTQFLFFSFSFLHDVLPVTFPASH